MSAPRAALYARVSTDEQDPGLQVEELRRLAEQRGWSVVGEYVDHGVSGSKTTARSIGVSVSTLRRRLREAGEWPRSASVERPRSPI